MENISSPPPVRTKLGIMFTLLRHAAKNSYLPGATRKGTVDVRFEFLSFFKSFNLMK